MPTDTHALAHRPSTATWLNDVTAPATTEAEDSVPAHALTTETPAPAHVPTTETPASAHVLVLEGPYAH